MKSEPDSVPRDKSYGWNLGESLSQVLNAVIGGDADITFSANCGHWQEEKDWRGKVFGGVVNLIFFDKNHCANAWKKRT